MSKTSITYIVQSLFALLLFSASHASLAQELDSLGAILAGEHREAANVTRDKYRHPRATLQFFGIKPDMKVVEILPGRGWYTEILAPYLRDQGQLIIANMAREGLNDYFLKIVNTFNAKLAANPGAYGKTVQTIYRKEGKFLPEVADNSVDMVINTRNTHNMIRFGGIEQAYSAFYRVLKPGGILAIVQHRAAPGSDAAVTAQNGYVPEDYLIKFCEDLGFKLAGKSEINANPKDNRDHPKGVWTLPPTYALGDKDREKYSAIGESDRMTLKFIKPAGS